jgi:hypothetical protein
MKQTIFLLQLFLTLPLVAAEIESPAAEWDFMAAPKVPVLLFRSTDLTPGPVAFAEGALYFANCPVVGKPCNGIYRLTATDPVPQRVVETENIARLQTVRGKVVVQLTTDTVFYTVDNHSLVPWRSEQRTKTEAAARFHLHAMASADTALPASVYQHPLLRPSIDATGDGFGFQIFSIDVKSPLLLGYLAFSGKAPPVLMPFNQPSTSLVAPTAQQFYLTTETAAADGATYQGLNQVNLAQKTQTALGGDPAGKVEPLFELNQAEWKARSIVQVDATQQGALLVSTTSAEPGEAGGLWYFPKDSSPEAGKVRAVRGVADSDLSHFQMTPFGLLVTHVTDKSIALYPSVGAMETAPLAPWKKKAEALTKAWGAPSKMPCDAYVVVDFGTHRALRFRERTADGVPSYRSLLSFTPQTEGREWVCDPKQGPVFLSKSVGLVLRQDALLLDLDASSLYGSNSAELLKLAERKGSYSAAANIPRLSSKQTLFSWDSPVLFQLQGRTLKLARVPLKGSQFASLTATEDEVEVRLQTAGTIPPVAFQDYMHRIPFGSSDFLPVNYTEPKQEPKP